MQKYQWFSPLILLIAASLSWTLPLNGDEGRAEWPQWRGPNRDGISSETGLLETWPEGGPKVLWRIPLGEGFSGVSVSQGRLYTLFAQGDDAFAVCLDASSGKELWRFRVGDKFVEGAGNGPRSTPTLDGDRVYVLGARGKLFALNSTSGKKVWERDFVNEFGSKVPNWGFSTSPLVEGGLLLVEVGGEEGKSVAAFDKKSGKEVWTSHTDRAAYSSPIVVTFNKVRQILFLTSKALLSVSPKDGQIYWQYPWLTHDGINVATPIFVPPDKIFLSSSYGYGAALVKMKTSADTLSVEEVWRSKVMKNHFNSSVQRGDYLYGFDDAILRCIKAGNGEEQWGMRGFGKGSLLLVEGHLIVLGDAGQLALVEATPVGYTEKARAQVLEGKCWTVPTLASGRLYVRNEKELVCLDMKGKSSGTGN